MKPGSVVAPGSLPYLGLCLVGMVLVTTALLFQGARNLNGIVLAVGMGSLVARFGFMPYLYLGAIAFVQFSRERRFETSGNFQLDDLLLAAGTLLYMASIFRLHGLTKTLGPYDSRLSAKPVPDGPTLPANFRTGAKIHPLEFAWLLLMIPVFVFFGQFLTLYLRSEYPLPFHEILVLVWSLALGLLVVGLLFNLWRRAQMDGETAQLVLQETLWQQTRSEQDRIAAGMTDRRWITWGSAFRFAWTLFKIALVLAALERLLTLQRFVENSMR